MATNWAELGLEWESGEVSRQNGPNKTDRRVIGTGQILRVADVDKAVAAGLGEAIMAGVNGTSWRVTSQGVSRSYIEGTKPSERDEEELRGRIFNRIKGMRNAALSSMKVVVAPLPDGTSWTGTNADEYEDAYFGILSASGVDENVAVGLAAKMTLAVRAELEK